MSLENSLGYSASTLCVISLIPEVYYSIKNKRTQITYGFLLIQIGATSLWIAYEVIINSVPLLIADSCILAQLIFLCIMKCASQKKNNKIHPELNV